MEYYVVYDINDNIICYIDNFLELLLFTGLRKKDINYKFKNKDFINVDISNKRYHIYKFS